MKPQPFALERYFARYEFNVRYLLCSSDPESMPVGELLALEPGATDAFARVWLGYTPIEGSAELRRAIAAQYREAGEDGVLVHAGAQEAIFTFAHAVLQPGDHAIVQVPAYQSHYAVAESLGVEILRWHADFSHGGAPDPDELARLIRPNTRALVVTTPSNPTGYTFDRARFDATVALARKHGLWLLCDEVYRGSERDPADRLPPAVDCYERAVSVGGTAKVHGLAGLRIGWVVTRDAALHRDLCAFKDYLSICNSAPSEFLAEIALRHQERLFERSRGIAARNLDHLDAFFARHAGLFEWMRPRAGTTAFPRYLRGSTERFCAELVERAGVLLLPSRVFDAGDERFRIGYGRANVPEALSALERFLTQARV